MIDTMWWRTSEEMKRSQYTPHPPHNACNSNSSLQQRSRDKPHETWSTRYHLQKEEEAVKQAEECGYIVTVDQELIKSHLPKHDIGKSCIDDSEIKALRFLRLDSSRIRNLCDIGICVNLRVLMLGANFISRIDAIASCTQLIKLDVHGNQVCSSSNKVCSGSNQVCSGFIGTQSHSCTLSICNNQVN